MQRKFGFLQAMNDDAKKIMILLNRHQRTFIVWQRLVPGKSKMFKSAQLSLGSVQSNLQNTKNTGRMRISQNQTCSKTKVVLN
jgi:hypothetical protein